MILISIDPGVAYYGAALWSGQRLISTLLVSGIDRPRVLTYSREWLYPDRLVIEKPQVYRHARARSSDIVDLAMAAQRISDLWPTIAPEFVLPREWKGQTPKVVCQKRWKAWLAPDELALMAYNKSDASHVWDAVGIGLWTLGRK